MTLSVYSVGYANKPFPSFLAHLKKHAITVVADVRSSPWSRTFPEYNADTIRAALEAEGILYVTLGAELGPRSKDLTCYRDSGQVDFSLLARTELFEQGVARLSNGIKQGHTIAMMCAEKDPATCHRSLLIGHALYQRGWQIHHVDHDGDIESQTSLERRLMRNWRLDQPSMFDSDDELRELAWQKQCDKYAWRDPLFATNRKQEQGG